MNVKRIFCLLFISLFIGHVYGQIPKGLPHYLLQQSSSSNGSPSYQQLENDYDLLMADQDTNLNHKKKLAQRWWNYYFLNYNIEPGGQSYNSSDYSSAIRAIYTSSLNCDGNDPANWISDGPWNIPDFPFYLTSGPLQHAGGWIDAIYNDPNNLDNIVIGTRTSGIMRTTNGGTNWQSVTDHLSFPVLGVRQILASPSNSSYLLALTGTDDINGGVLYSTDAGANWNEVTASIPEFYWASYHPTINGLVFATSRDQLWYSNDDGLTWSSLGAPTGFDDDTHFLFKLMVSDDNLFVNSRQTHFAAKSVLYKTSFSMVSGSPVLSSWSDISNVYIGAGQILFFSGFSNRLGNRFILEAQGGVWVGPEVDDYNYTNYLFETTDGGDNFSSVGISVTNPTFHKNELILSPNDANTMYFGTVKYMKKYDLTTGSYTQIYGEPGNNGHHDDYRCSQIIDVGAIDKIVVGNDGGPALIPDGLVASPRIQSLNGDLSINLIHAFDVHEREGRVAYGFQDHAMYYRDPDLSYSAPFIWEGSAAMVQQDYPDAIVGEDAYSGIKDRDEITHPIVDGTLGNSQTYLGGYFVPYRHHPDRFARGLGAPGNIAMNRAANVSVIENIPIASKGIGPVAICERDASVIYAADKSRLDHPNKFYKSTDDGYTWFDLSTTVVLLDGGATVDFLFNLLRWNHIRALAVDHNDPDLVYCGIGGTHKVGSSITDERFRVIRSTNGGSSFTDYSEGLPALPVERLLTIDSDNDLIFCATSVGIYYRTNTMSSWQCFSKNLPKAMITGLKYDYCNDMLYASTYGRGMWKTPVDLGVSSSYTTLIETNTVWNTPRIVHGNVLVKSGYTLEITDEVRMGKDKKIMIEAGAKLDVNGGTITSFCNNFWGGIEVWGNYLLSQNSYSNQGYLLVRNNAVIENAKEAVLVHKPGDWSKNGGIVRAYNSTFRNNWRSVAYMGYHHYSAIDPSIEYTNKGLFNDCKFQWTDSYLGNGVAPHFTMHNVYGVSILGCDFEDNRTTGITNRNYGIFTLDAGYKVMGKNLDWPANVDHEYDETDYDVGTFKNLKGGINAKNANSAYTVTVDHCKFENSLRGIELSVVDNAVITRNKFEYNSSHPTDIGHMYQCNLQYSNGYLVEGNLFESSVPYSETMGVYVDNSGWEQNQIYRNTYQQLKVGNYSLGVNTNDILGVDVASGLQWLCNEYISNYTADQYVHTNFGIHVKEGIRLHQGDEPNSAGNQLSNALGTSLPRRHFYTNDIHYLYYFNSPSDPLPPVPYHVTGNVVLLNTALASNSCPSSFTGLQVEHASPSFIKAQTYPGILAELATVEARLALSQSIFAAQTATGNTPQLHQKVDNLTLQNSASVKQDLEQASPYLSKEIMVKLGEKSDSLYPHNWYAQLIEMNIELAHDPEFMNFLLTKNHPLPQNLYTHIDTIRHSISTGRGDTSRNTGPFDVRTCELQNLLIMHEIALDSIVEWSKQRQYLNARNDAVLRSQLADSYLGNGDLNQCGQQLNDITTNLNGYTDSVMKQEMADFVTFKQYILTLTDQHGFIQNLGNQEHQQLSNYASTLTGRAKTQAQNMLCFHFDECTTINPSFSTSKRDMEELLTTPEEHKIEELQFSIVPNPNQGNFRIVLADQLSIAAIHIYDVQGRQIELYDLELNGNQAEISMRNSSPGTYFGLIRCSDETVIKTKFIVE